MVYQPGAVDLAAEIARVAVDLGQRHPRGHGTEGRTQQADSAYLAAQSALEDARRACLRGELDAARAALAMAKRAA